MRGSAHSKELRLYEITDDGVLIGEPVRDHEGLLGGSPRKASTSQIGIARNQR
jgi:circadian clock protein KaiC